MCTYVTNTVNIRGSAKGAHGWSTVANATIYFDHPYHAAMEHSLNVDFAADGTRQVAVELSAESARALAHAILATLDTGEAQLLQ
ncbi:MAG: DUF6295 family protein [Acidimicrobiales bacterium]